MPAQNWKTGVPWLPVSVGLAGAGRFVGWLAGWLTGLVSLVWQFLVCFGLAWWRVLFMFGSVCWWFVGIGLNCVFVGIAWVCWVGLVAGLPGQILAWIGLVGCRKYEVPRARHRSFFDRRPSRSVIGTLGLSPGNSACLYLAVWIGGLGFEPLVL